MRSLFAKEITNMAKENGDIVLLSGDIGNKMFDGFKEIAPSRFFNCGIAEANMMSMASGMALSGLRPYIYTITPFTTTRCLEQIKIGAAYHDSNVVIVGTGSGLSYAELGPTHHSLEDIAILRAIPGIRILTPSDPMELKIQLLETVNLKGPTYVRIGKKGEPNLHKDTSNLGIGKANILREGKNILVLAIGPIVSEAIKAIDELMPKDMSIAIATMSSVRPLDKKFLERMLERGFENWLTLEEHGLVGGLGSTILEWASDYKVLDRIKLTRLGVDSKFIHKLGNQAYTRKILGIDSIGIKTAIESL